ncbi:MAG TPA: GNAT family N-acetyltransferase [Dehalococcoidia bacterium]|nr:GNAT family N-acetyltransferase [Dehalococcoidia bacterium]
MIELLPVRRKEIEKLAPMILAYWQELDEDGGAGGARDVEDAKRLLYGAISRGGGIFWIAEGNDEVGFVEYDVSQHWSRPEIKVGRIAEIYVDPGHRRVGAGRAAMEKIIAQMTEDDVAYVTLATSIRNESARRFWEALGFHEDRIEMKRTLKEPTV